MSQHMSQAQQQQQQQQQQPTCLTWRFRNTIDPKVTTISQNPCTTSRNDRTTHRHMIAQTQLQRNKNVATKTLPERHTQKMTCCNNFTSLPMRTPTKRKMLLQTVGQSHQQKRKMSQHMSQHTRRNANQRVFFNECFSKGPYLATKANGPQTNASEAMKKTHSWNELKQTRENHCSLILLDPFLLPLQ